MESKPSFAHRCLRTLLHHQRSVLAVVLATTVASVFVVTRVQFSSSVIESFVNKREDYLRAMELEGRFVANPDSVVWLATQEGEQLFTHETLRAIQLASRELSALPYVQRVFSVTDLPFSVGPPGGARSTAARAVLNAKLKHGEVPDSAIEYAQTPRTISRLLDVAAERNKALSANQIQQIQEIAAQQLVGTPVLVAKDSQTQLMLVELIAAEELPPAAQIELVAKLEAVVRSHQLGRNGLHLSGLIPMQAFAYEQINLVLRTLLPLGGLLIAVAVLIVFRRVEVILFTLIIATISNFWGIALGVLFYGKFSVLMAAVPLMVLVISTADVIHLLSSYTAERTAGHAHDVALKKMFTEVGGACILTSITTFVGFASLVVVPSNTIRQFGFSAAAGVAGALLLSVLLAPLFLQWLHGRNRPIQAGKSALRFADLLTMQCLGASLRYPKLIIGSAVAGLAVCGWATSKLTLDPDLSKRFTPSHPLSVSTDFLVKEFGGISSIELVLTGRPEVLLSPETLLDIRRFETRVLEETTAEHVGTPVAPLGEALMKLDYGSDDGTPESTEHAMALVRLLEASDPRGMAAMITPEHDALRIVVQVKATSYMRLLDMAEEIYAIANQTFPSTLTILKKGSAPLIGEAVREIIKGHIQGFGLCFTAIFILIVIGLRSFRLGWISILPNLTPLLVLGGMLATGYRRVDSDILAVATLGLGLAVDDTIHFMSRLQIELSHRAQDMATALERTMKHTGVAIIRTTIVLAVGFFPFAFSGYWSIRMLGTYLVAVLFSALVADLLLLPAILSVAMKPRKLPPVSSLGSSEQSASSEMSS